MRRALLRGEPGERGSRRGAAEVFLWIGVGALVGSGGAVLVREGPWWSAALVHYAAPYALLAVLIGASSPRARVTALCAAACFVTFVVAYYAVVAAQFGSIPVLYASAWLLAAVSVCPVAAAAVHWAAGRRGVLPAGVFAVAGSVALSDGALGNLIRFAIGRLDPSSVPSVLWVIGPVDLAVALAIVLLVPRQRNTRLSAAALLVPLAMISTWIGWTVHFGVGPYR